MRAQDRSTITHHRNREKFYFTDTSKKQAEAALRVLLTTANCVATLSITIESILSSLELQSQQKGVRDITLIDLYQYLNIILKNVISWRACY